MYNWSVLLCSPLFLESNFSMKFSSAIPYYLSSIPTLLFRSNALTTPLLLLKRPIVISLENGMKFYVSNLMDIWTLKEVILDKQYERFVSLPNQGTIIDIGGAIGEFSLYAAKNENAVFAYEVDDERVDLFKKNQLLNRVKNVKLYHMKATSLDQIFKENNLKQCSLLKIDCEGDEYPIFQNTSDSILKKIDTITMEIHLWNPAMRKDFILLRKRLQQFFTVQYFPNQVHEYIGYVSCQRKNEK